MNKIRSTQPKERWKKKMFRPLCYVISILPSLLIAVIPASAQTQPSKEYGYVNWIKCSDGYGGALSWKGYPLGNAQQAARYPNGDLQNVHVHVLKAKADVERDGRQAHDRAVKLCAAKIAMLSRPKNKDRLSTRDLSEDVRRSHKPSVTGRIVIFDDEDRIIGASEVLDMRQVGAIYAQHLMRQRLQE